MGKRVLRLRYATLRTNGVFRFATLGMNGDLRYARDERGNRSGFPGKGSRGEAAEAGQGTGSAGSENRPEPAKRRLRITTGARPAATMTRAAAAACSNAS